MWLIHVRTEHTLAQRLSVYLASTITPAIRFSLSGQRQTQAAAGIAVIAPMKTTSTA
jgi:hypothetical protein